MTAGRSSVRGEFRYSRYLGKSRVQVEGVIHLGGIVENDPQHEANQHNKQKKPIRGGGRGWGMGRE